ncbi:MAG: hypothetical protein R3E96_13745 [Planctomycetota bacterium]
MKALNVFLAILVSGVSSWRSSEIGLRVLGMGPVKILNHFDPALGWSKVPELDVTRKNPEFEVHFRFNKLGLREDEDQRVKAPKANPACWRSATRSPWDTPSTARISSSTNSNTGGTPRAVTWTSSTPAPRLLHRPGGVVWLQEHGADWNPDLVLLFAYENDILYHGERNYFNFPKPRFTADGTREPDTLRDPGSRGFWASTAVGNLLRKKAKLETFTPEGGEHPVRKEFAPNLVRQPEFLNDAVARTTGSMRALAATARDLGVPAVVVVIPSHAAVDEAYAQLSSEAMGLDRSLWDPNRPVTLLADAAREAGLQVLDPTAALRAASSSEDPLYFDVDFHFTPRGNRVFTEYLHGALKDLAPAAAQATPLANMPDPPPAHKSHVPRWLLAYLFLVAILGSLYGAHYKDEKVAACFAKVGGLLGLVFGIAIGGSKLLAVLPPHLSRVVFLLALIVLFGFIAYKLGDRLRTIGELFTAFVARGHWYLMPLVMILLSIGSLLVVAASSRSSRPSSTPSSRSPHGQVLQGQLDLHRVADRARARGGAAAQVPGRRQDPGRGWRLQHQRPAVHSASSRPSRRRN